MDCTSSRNIKWMIWTFRAAPVQHLPKKCGQRPTKGIKSPHLRDELAPRIGFEEPHALYRAQPANLGALGPLIRVRMRGLKTTSSSSAHTDSDDRGIPGFETLPLRNTFTQNNPRRAETNTPQSTLYTFHCPPCTLDFTICTLHWALHTLHFTLHTLHFTLHTIHPTLHTLHFVLHSSHFTLHTLHFARYTPHSTLYTSHSTVYTWHFTLYASHFTLHTLHWTLHTLHFTLYTPHRCWNRCCYLVFANCRKFFAICTFLAYGLWAVFF